jgi:hypothetical protein
MEPEDRRSRLALHCRHTGRTRRNPCVVLAECHERAQEAMGRGALARRPPARIATAAIVASWLPATALVAYLIIRAVHR